MEEESVFNMVQGQIGYTFENIDLLRQAFTRRSYSQENGGENNEVLEFIGDKALDFAVVQLLTAKFGSMKNGDPVDGTKLSVWEKEQLHRKGLDDCEGNNEFSCTYDEGGLTKIKSRMVEKKYLARRMDEMGFSEHLRMGKSDMMNNVANESSVKEDLFEAILGAVTIDCGWDWNRIQSVAEAMLIPEDFLADDSYVRRIVDWEMQENRCVPWFWFKDGSYERAWYVGFDGISQPVQLEDYSKIKYHCELKLLDSLPVFRGFGASKSEARENVCKLAYDYLCRNGYIYEPSIRDEIEDPNKDDAINQLEILARRGYFDIPEYSFGLEHDGNGNPVWTCECHINEVERRFEAVSSSKKDAKKSAAFEMLEYVLREEE